MIRPPLALRLATDAEQSPRELWRGAAALGVRGLVLDASGELAPHRLSETARRDVRQSLRTLELSLVALNLPTRRPFDSLDQLEDRLARAESAFELAFGLGTRLVLLRAGTVPPETDSGRYSAFLQAMTELGRRADRRGIRLAIETGGEPVESLCKLLQTLEQPSLAASLDPSGLLSAGLDPAQAVVTLGDRLAHVYATDGAASSFRMQPGVRHASGFGYPPGALDWEAYLGALEEIDYRGFLTIWPDPRGDVGTEARRVLDILKRF